jgi:hypothetical protein
MQREFSHRRVDRPARKAFLIVRRVCVSATADGSP